MAHAMKAQRPSRGMGVLSVNLGVRREWLVDTRSRPFTLGIYCTYVQETGWFLETARTALENRKPLALRGSTSNRPACSKTLHRLSYPNPLCQGPEF